MKTTAIKALSTLCLAALFTPAATWSETANDWQFGAAIYGWLPDINGKTAFSDETGGDGFEIEVGDILDNLKFTMMGTFDARKGRWGVVTDVIYMSIGKSESALAEGSIGEIEIPVDVTADVDFDLKSWVWTAAGYYRAVESPNTSFDILAGFRYIDVEQKLDWSLSGNIGQIPLPGREGGGKAELANWDAIIGVRGRFSFGQDNAWFLPYYVDVGTGDSDFTWQGAAGLGYAFGWGELAAVWRYLYYDLPSDRAVADMNFSGPAFGVVFHW